MRIIRNNVGGADQKIWAGYETSSANRRQKTEKTRQSGQRSGFRKALSCLLCLLILVSNLLQPVAAMDLPISFDPDHPEKTIVLHRLEKETESDQNPPRDSEEETKSETESDTGIETITEAMTEIGAETEAETGIELSGETEAETEPLVLVSEGADYRIVVTYGPDAGIPYDAELKVSEILPEKQDDAQNAHEQEKSYEEYVSDAETALDGKEKITFARFFDICIMKDGEEIQPAGPVSVRIELPDELTEDIKAVHFEKEEAPEVSKDQQEPATIENPVLLDAEVTPAEEMENAVVFETGGFSVFGVFGTTIEKTVLARNGRNYKITVTYGPEAKIPDDADLSVEEILPAEDLEDGETDLWQEYVSMVDSALGWEDQIASYIRLFDIKIVKKGDSEIKYQPTEGTTVDVKIELADKETSEEAVANTQVVHIADGAETGDLVEALEVDGSCISFAAEGFSAYAIVEGPPAVDLGWTKVASVADLDERGFFIGHTSGYYFMDSLVTEGNRTGIKKTKPASSSPPTSGSQTASLYYFEKISGTEDQFYIYCKDGENKKYVQADVSSRSLLYADNDENKTSFTVIRNSNGSFSIKVTNNDAWYCNMQGSANGKRFCIYNEDNDDSKLYIWNQLSDVTSDPYDLNGKSYTLLTWDGGKSGKALTDDENTDYPGDLCAEFLTVMTKSGDAGDKLYVPNNTADTVTSWTFTWLRNDLYNLSVENGGEVKYLKIDDNGLSLVGQPQEASDIQVVPGTGIHKGQIILRSGNNVLTYSGEYAKGFNINAGTGKEYLYLAEAKDESLLDDYYRTYSASKISVSDPSLSPDSPEAEPKKIIIYTRVWNGSGYTYFAINGEGELVPCFERGDSIQWIGSTLDELQWEFTEYGDWNEDKTEFTPNYYYELQNAYTKKYLAPLMEGKDGKPEQILSDSPIGLNMSGRRNGQYYTPVLAWDKDNYAFAGIKVDLEAGAGAVIEPCLSREGLDFYFATVDEIPVDDTLHTVATVDNNQYGISMRLVNFGTREQMSAFLDNNDGGLTTKLVQGLLSTNLGEDGYPTAKGGSLGTLFRNAAESQEANYLFTDSVFRATGYYEYDSAQNYAHLIKDSNDPWIGKPSPNGGTYKIGDFVVYQELGSYDASDRYTLKHGQFFPFNDLEAGVFANTNGRNLYTPTGERLDESDPRYNEQLYLIKNADCYFGTELTATFDQTPSGLDAWGHDIIFEFSGDDDFWLYVDGELIIDLGGIHSAVPGWANFRTGEVYVNGTSTTLYQLFHDNYAGRGIAEEEITKKLLGDPSDPVNYPGIFTGVNGVFKDYTSHTMRIFYMERGAGASNLHMRFNLAAVKRGTVQLTKQLSNNEDSGGTATAYPYQIWYKNPESGQYEQLTEENMGGTSGGTVKYKGSVNDIEYKKDYIIDHSKDDVIYRVKYNDVFLLPAGETAEITFPTFGETGEEKYVTEYKIVECGVDPEVYIGVTVDGTALEGINKTTNIKVVDGQEETLENYEDSGLKDYEINYSTLEARPRVTYVNEVNETKTLNIKKELYKNENGERSRINLYDESGDPINPDSPDLERVFEFRLRLKAPNSEADAWENNKIIYHVKDPKGNYCIWDKNAGKLVTTGKSNFADLTDDTTVDGKTVLGEKTLATFQSSENGAMSDIPAYYTVEVKGLIPGTEYQVVERPEETPNGYQFWKYKAGSKETAEGADPLLGIEGSITSGDSSNEVLVCNDKGYELRLEKVWSDASTMMNRDPSYFAVFYEVMDDTGKVTERKLVEGSVEKLAYDAKPQKLNWWYLSLPGIEGVDNPAFDRYAVYEVTGSFTVDDQGEVIDSQNVVPILDGGILSLNGTPRGGSETSILYKVTYDDPQTVGDNVREYKVTNTPSEIPAVKFLKENWSSEPLEGASFTLKHGTEAIFSKTSDNSGVISKEYLSRDTDYVLTETAAPQGYFGLQHSLTIKLVSDEQDGWTLHVTSESGDISDYYKVGHEYDEDVEYVTMTIKNHPYEFEAIKVDSTGKDLRVEGAVFELYEQTTVGSQTDWKRMEWDGQSELRTDLNGVIPHLDRYLPANTYQLRETTPAAGYSRLSGTIKFTINQQGVIRLGTHPDGVNLSGPTEGTGDKKGSLIYTLTIPNEPLPLYLKKVDESGKELKGAKFSLYHKKQDTADGNETSVNGEGADEHIIWISMEGSLSVYNNIDMTKLTEFSFESLPADTYRLEETEAPEGYVITVGYHYFVINPDRTVSLCDEDGNKVSGNTWGNATLSRNDNIFTITVKNTPGVALPSTGGRGTGLLYLFGILLTGIAGAGFVLRRRRRIA